MEFCKHQIQSMPRAAYRPNCARIGDDIIIADGNFKQTLYAYNEKSKKYRTFAEYPCTVQETRSVALLPYQNEKKQNCLLSIGTQETHFMSLTRTQNEESQKWTWKAEPESNIVDFGYGMKMSICENVLGMSNLAIMCGGNHKPFAVYIYDLFKHEWVLKNDNILPRKHFQGFGWYDHMFVKIAKEDEYEYGAKEIQEFIIGKDDMYYKLTYRTFVNHVYCEQIRYHPRKYGYSIRDFGYLFIDPYVVTFGGYAGDDLNEIWVYHIQRNEWHNYSLGLSFSISRPYAMLSRDRKAIHIIGGRTDESEAHHIYSISAIHMKPYRKLHSFIDKKYHVMFDLWELILSYSIDVSLLFPYPKKSHSDNRQESIRNWDNILPSKPTSRNSRPLKLWNMRRPMPSPSASPCPSESSCVSLSSSVSMSCNSDDSPRRLPVSFRTT